MRVDKSGELFAAVERGDLEAVRALLNAEPALVGARDSSGATALHHAAFHGHRAIAELLHAAGADLNARDATHGATPAGWAIHYLRERGALLAIEIEDALLAIHRGDSEWLARFVERHPALVSAADLHGTPLAVHARATADPEIGRLFTSHRSADET
jgi:ankyrin repeat protein